MDINPTIFKDYDIRGTYPNEINEDAFGLIAKELVEVYKPSKVAIGRDVRLASVGLQDALTKGFVELGVNVVDLGVISSDMHFFAAGKYDYDMAMIITGSHVKEGYGLKVSLKGAEALSGENGLYKIRDRITNRKAGRSVVMQRGNVQERSIINDWIQSCLKLIDIKTLKPLKIVIDTGNGVGGIILKEVERYLPAKFFNMYFEADGNFPNHFPNPIESKNLVDLINKVKREKADLGIAFDTDADRAFFIDGNGKSYTGTILTALLAKHFLTKNSGEYILYNAVCGRIVPETIKKYGGKPVRVRVGYSLIRPKMKQYNAVFCGEHSGHFFYRDLFYADSGLVTFLLIYEIMSKSGRTFADLTREFDVYAQSGEVNFVVDDKEKVIGRVENKFASQADSIDRLDGLSVWYKDSWFNLRPSNTEPLLRLNVEGNDESIMKNKYNEMEDYLISLGCKKK